MSNEKLDIFRFKGAKALNGTIGNTALSNPSPGLGIVLARFTSTAHGLLAGSNIYLQSLATDSYNGLRYLQAVATDTFDVVLRKAYSALTPAGTEIWFCGASYNINWDFIGFDLHLSAASATSENIAVVRDAAAGSQYDTNLYTADMNTVADVALLFDIPIPMLGGDVVKFTWANTNARTWGLSIYARPRA